MRDFERMNGLADHNARIGGQPNVESATLEAFQSFEGGI
jgi:hypothetical protein